MILAALTVALLMGGVTQVFGLIGATIGIISFIGLAFVFLRGSADKGTMESQDRSIKALTTELGIERTKRLALEHEVEVCKAELGVWKASVQHLPELAVLQAGVNHNSDLLAQVLATLKGGKP